MRVRALMIVVVLVAAAGIATRLIRSEPATEVWPSPPHQDQSHDYHTSVSLTFKEFRSAGNLFAGSVVIEMSPASARGKPDSKQLLLRFNRYGKPETLTYQGGGDEPIAVGSRPAWGSLTGKGTFSWTAIARPGPFFYPFDRYDLIVNPSLMEVT